MKTYDVVLPVAGSAYVSVEAESEEAAIEKAMEKVSLSDIEEWEALRQFSRGKVCYCPRPWEASAKEVDAA